MHHFQNDSSTKVYLYQPRAFNAQVEVAGVCCEYEGRILLLRRHADKIEGLTWGLPAGKLEAGEKPLEAALRELKEEAGFEAPPEALKFVAPFYVRRPEIDFIFHMFFLPLAELPLLNISTHEHIDSCWLTLQEGLRLPLISGGPEILEYFYLWRKNLKSLNAP